MSYYYIISYYTISYYTILYYIISFFIGGRGALPGAPGSRTLLSSYVDVPCLALYVYLFTVFKLLDFIYIYIYMYICTYTYIHTYVYVYIYIYTHIYIYIYVYIYVSVIHMSAPGRPGRGRAGWRPCRRSRPLSGIIMNTHLYV